MSNEVTTSTPAATFRAKAAATFHATADMTLHELCDEFVRLTEVIDAGTTVSTDEFAQTEYSDEAAVALQERKIVNGAARARFGFGFSTYDDF